MAIKLNLRTGNTLMPNSMDTGYEPWQIQKNLLGLSFWTIEDYLVMEYDSKFYRHYYLCRHHYDKPICNRSQYYQSY